jgi:hypothetical protein
MVEVETLKLLELWRERNWETPNFESENSRQLELRDTDHDRKPPGSDRSFLRLLDWKHWNVIYIFVKL